LRRRAQPCERKQYEVLEFLLGSVDIWSYNKSIQIIMRYEKMSLFPTTLCNQIGFSVSKNEMSTEPNLMEGKMDKKKNKSNDDLVKVLRSGDINSVYFNEFAIGVSKNDIFILLRRNGKEEAILNASHITVKSLAIALNEAIANFEEKTNQKIMVSEDIEQLIDDNKKE